MGYAAETDTGRVRDSNEDSLLAKPPVFAIADGMGGHSFGEIASALALKSVARGLRRVRPGEEPAAIERAIEDANREVFKEAFARAGRTGMGTTLTCALVRADTIHIGHVGDSRAYLLSGDSLAQLTADHSLVAELVRSGQLSEEEARVHPKRNVITRALGTEPSVTADTSAHSVSPGDRLLLCTDGLTGMLPDETIARLLAAAEPAEACRSLISAANDAGGEDNITVVVVEIDGSESAPAGGFLSSLTGWWKR